MLRRRDDLPTRALAGEPCKPAKSQSDEARKLAQQQADEARANAPQRWIDCYEQAKAEIAAQQIKDNPQNAGQAYPDFDSKDLYPDGTNTVEIGLLCGDREKDKAAANNIAGYEKTPVGKDGTRYVWHHTEDLGKLVLVREDTHQRNPHTGGAAIWKKYLGGSYK